MSGFVGLGIVPRVVPGRKTLRKIASHQIHLVHLLDLQDR